MILSEIEKLNELKEKGILTEDEFQKAKNKLLNDEISVQKNTQNITSRSTIKQQEKKQPSVALLTILFLGIFFIFANFITKISAPIEPVFDAMSFYTDAVSKTTVTQDELVSKLGNPEEIEDWNFKDGKGKEFKITTLYYDNYTYEYNFYENYLQRISINKDIPLIDKNKNLKLFNLSQNDNTRLNDTGSALRYYNCGVNDLWIWSINNNVAKGVKISYTTLFN